MTIVEPQAMNPNQNLEDEMDVDADMPDAYDEGEFGVEEDGQTDEEDGHPAGNPEVAEWAHVVRKRADGVTVTVIDTPGLVDGDTVSEQVALLEVGGCLQYPVDVVLFLDRVDMPKPDELDLQMMTGLTKMLGSDIWNRVVIGLTRADVKDPPPGQTYEAMIERRVEGIRGVMRRGGGRNAELPYVLIENSERCGRNAAGEKMLENRQAWIPAMVETVVEVAQKFPTSYRYNPKTVNRSQILFQKFCVIPLVLMAQILFKVLILDRVIAADGLRGDRYGPYDMAQKEYEQSKLREMQENKNSEKTERSSMPAKREREISLEDEMSDESEDELNED